MSWRERFKHAFAIDKGPTEPTERQIELVDMVCRAVVRRGLIVPALLAVEMGRPLNFVASQAMHFFQPIVSVILDGPSITEFASFLEQRGSIEYLCQRLEHWNQVGPDFEDKTSQTPAENHGPPDESDRS